jgi:hypothetical protein
LPSRWTRSAGRPGRTPKGRRRPVRNRRAERTARPADLRPRPPRHQAPWWTALRRSRRRQQCEHACAAGGTSDSSQHL